MTTDPRTTIALLIREHGLAAVSEAFERNLAAEGQITLRDLHARMHAHVTRGQLTLADEGLSSVPAHERLARMMEDLDTLASERGRLEVQHDDLRARALRRTG